MSIEFCDFVRLWLKCALYIRWLQLEFADLY